MKTTELRTGDILLYRSSHFLARAIRFFTRGQVNHAAICLSIWNEMFVAESERPGFIPNKLADSIKGREVWVMRYNKPINERSFALRISAMLGKHRYDFASLLFFQVWYAITGKWVGRRDSHASKRLYCSEAVAYIYNLETGEMPEWWRYNPQMLWNQPGFTKVKLEL